MATDGSLRFDTEIDESGFNKGLKSLSKNAKGIGKILKGFTLGFIGVKLVSNAVRGLRNIADQAIALSSDMQEVQNVVDTAFGSMAYKAEEFADSAIDQFGMSRLAAKRTASTYMAMGKSMGLSMEAASDMAIETAKLTGDVASFYNLSQDLAATKLKGIWTGETEALKDIGVVMTEVNLQQFALNKGITKSYSAMSQAEKVALWYEYVMENLADAQGDFARTSDSWANQTRVLSERWKELLSIIGGGLIRVFTPVIQVINAIMAALVNLANTFANTMGKLFGWNKQMKITGSTGAEAAEGQEELADATASAGEAAAGSLASFDKLDVLQQNTGAGGGPEVPQVEMMEEEVTQEAVIGVGRMSEEIRKLRPYVDRLKDAWDRLKGAVEGFWNAPGVKAIRDWLGEEFRKLVEHAAQVLSLLLVGAINILAGAFDMLGGIISIVVGLMTGDLDMAFDGFKQACKGMGEVLSGLGAIFEAVLVTILGADAVEALKNWITQAGEWFVKTDFYTQGVKKAIEGLNVFIKGVFTRDWKLAWEGVAQIFKSVWNTMMGILESALNLIVSAINWCINQINRIHVAVPDWVTELTGMTGFGFNIPNLSGVSIPRLATGAVIPPNSEFLAMLGDQRSGNNIEAPESLIRQIVREESGSGNIVINARGTMGQLIRLLKLEIEKEDDRSGPSFAPGGAY